MNKRIKILMTGGTGFLGKYVLETLRTDADIEVDVISRSKTTEIQGDLTKWNAGIDIDSLASKNYDVFLNLAGLYDLTASRSDVLINNVVGTSTALRIAGLLKIPVFVSTSSIAAATNLSAFEVGPYDVDFSRPFHDPYAESKALTEQQLKNCLSPIRIKINLRLGILVGDSVNGKIMRIDGPYHTASTFSQLKKFIESWKLRLPVPGNPDVRLPLVPVDIAAKALVQIAKWGIGSKETGYKSFHIVPNEGLSIKELYISTLQHLEIHHSQLLFIKHIPDRVAMKISQHALGFPEEQLRYALHLPRYNSDDTCKILGTHWCPEFSNYEKNFWSGYENYLQNR
ncbi:MAG: SDR family oxidoreductase [Bdellovibrionota bacterium]